MTQGEILAKKSDLKRPKTIADLLFKDDRLSHLLEHAMVRHFMGDLLSDFNTAYTALNSTPIPPGDTDDKIEVLRDLKTDLFQAFVTGVLWARNPDGRFCSKIEASTVKPKEEKSGLILTP